MNGDTEMLEVEFTGSDINEFDCYGLAGITCSYDGVNYLKLTKNVEFDIVECNRVVGSGNDLE